MMMNILFKNFNQSQRVAAVKKLWPLTILHFLPFILRTIFWVSIKSWGILNAVCLICELFAHFIQLTIYLLLLRGKALPFICINPHHSEGKDISHKFLVCILKFIFTKGFLNFERDRSIHCMNFCQKTYLLWQKHFPMSKSSDIWDLHPQLKMSLSPRGQI